MTFQLGNNGSLKKDNYEAWWASQPNVASDKKSPDRILRLLDTENGHQVLDVGCGGGDFITRATELGLVAVGVDFSRESLRISQSRSTASLKVMADAHALPFREEVFDRVVCLGSLEHFEHPSKAASEMSRVLKGPSGKCLLFVPNSYFLGHVFIVMRTGEPPDEGRQFFAERFGTKMQWRRLLEQSGLHVTSVHKYNTIRASKKVGLGFRLVYNFIIRPFLPSNLSYGWMFLCVKSSDSNGVGRVVDARKNP